MFDDDYTAVHERRPYMTDNNTLDELLLTRKKLEVRTFLLRIAVGLLTGTWTGIIIYFFTNKAK